THTLRVTLPVFEKCMRAKGWVLDHYAPDSSVPVHGTVESYTDTRGDARGHPRGTAALHADEQACKARGHGSLKHCLAGRGWQLMYAQHGPAQRHFMRQRGFASGWRQPVPSYNSDPSPDPSPPTGPDTAGMNTPTNPTWSGFNQ